MTDQQIKLPEKQEEIFSNPQKILICAPSNAAIDQILRLILNKGLLNEEGGKSFPSIVRVGPNFHSDLVAVSLEQMVATETQGDSNQANENQIRNNVNSLLEESNFLDFKTDQDHLWNLVCCRFELNYQ
jgi:superfamily I DNA and/or RNA helicase